MADFFEENQYVESIFGFRRYAPLTFNEFINEPIQSSASDIVIDAMNRLSEYAQKNEKPQFQASLNIHDDLIFPVPYKTLEDYHDIIVEPMLITFKFITDVI